jgi:hypothetical protein
MTLSGTLIQSRSFLRRSWPSGLHLAHCHLLDVSSDFGDVVHRHARWHFAVFQVTRYIRYARFLEAKMVGHDVRDRLGFDLSGLPTDQRFGALSF